MLMCWRKSNAVECMMESHFQITVAMESAMMIVSSTWNMMLMQWLLQRLVQHLHQKSEKLRDWTQARKHGSELKDGAFKFEPQKATKCPVEI